MRREKNTDFKRTKEDKITYAKRMVEENNITNEQELREHIMKQGIIEEVMFKMGPNYEAFFRPLIRHQVLVNTQAEKETTYKSIAEEYWIPQEAKKQNVEWLNKWFQKQGVDKEKFVEAVVNITEKRLDKINSFTLQGKSNSGKTMMFNLILKPYNKGYMTRDGNQGPFMYQNLLDKSVCIDEETDIVPQNEQTRKLIMEGATIEVPVKNQDNAKLHRIPMFISTNHSLGKWISPMGYAAILNRMYLFKIDAVIGVDLEKPECEITFSDWWKCVRECQIFKKNTKRATSRKPKSKNSEMETGPSEEVAEE